MSTDRFDCVIAGAGAAGMFGALVAARGGLRVALIERDWDGPSNLLVSGGLFPAAGTAYQRAVGIEDSPSIWAADIRAKAAGDANDAIVDAVAEISPSVAGFLAESLRIPVHLAATVPAPGHRVPRLHATAKESGRELHALLRAQIEIAPNVTVVRDAEASGLLTREGEVHGLVVRENGVARELHANAVLLATGGFAANRALLAEFLPAMTDAMHIGAGRNDGCAIEWGRALGAGVAFMNGYQGQGHVTPGGRTRLGMGLPLLGAFMVNRLGERFVREDFGPSELGQYVLAQPGGVALEVFDQRCHDAAIRQGPYQEAWRAGAVFSAPDLAALAQSAGIPIDALHASFEQLGRALCGELADPLGRTRFGPQHVPPFFAGWVTGALAHTQGGLAVDRQARVCRDDRTPIAGLYAAGGAAASLAGQGGEGYLPGNGLGQSFGLAMLAARSIIAQPARRKYSPRA